MHPRNNGIAIEYFSDLSWTTYHLGALNYNQTPNKCLNEIGFHTHVDDLPKLLDDNYRNLFAGGYFDGRINGRRLVIADKVYTISDTYKDEVEKRIAYFY